MVNLTLVFLYFRTKAFQKAIPGPIKADAHRKRRPSRSANDKAKLPASRKIASTPCRLCMNQKNAFKEIRKTNSTCELQGRNGKSSAHKKLLDVFLHTLVVFLHICYVKLRCAVIKTHYKLCVSNRHSLLAHFSVRA